MGLEIARQAQMVHIALIGFRPLAGNGFGNTSETLVEGNNGLESFRPLAGNGFGNVVLKYKGLVCRAKDRFRPLAGNGFGNQLRLR